MNDSIFLPLVEDDSQKLSRKSDDNKYQECFPYGPQPITPKPPHSPITKRRRVSLSYENVQHRKNVRCSLIEHEIIKDQQKDIKGEDLV